MTACGRQASSSSEGPPTTEAPPLPPDRGDDVMADDHDVTAEDPADADVMAVDEAGTDEMEAMMRVGDVEVQADEDGRLTGCPRMDGRTPPHPRPPRPPRRLCPCPRPL
jgi:hypothetical protein